MTGCRPLLLRLIAIDCDIRATQESSVAACRKPQAASTIRTNAFMTLRHGPGAISIRDLIRIAQKPERPEAA
jgi:hypothetical protein